MLRASGWSPSTSQPRDDDDDERSKAWRATIECWRGKVVGSTVPASPKKKKERKEKHEAFYFVATNRARFLFSRGRAGDYTNDEVGGLEHGRDTVRCGLTEKEISCSLMQASESQRTMSGEENRAATHERLVVKIATRKW